MTEAIECSQCGMPINPRVDSHYKGEKDGRLYFIHPACREEWVKNE